MKKYSQYFVGGLCALAVAFSAGTFMKVNAATVPAQPVDLTYAAEKALPAVVHIRYVQNSKVKTVDVQSDPFGDFFADPFGSLAIPVREMEEHRNDKCKRRSARLPGRG